MDTAQLLFNTIRALAMHHRFLHDHFDLVLTTTPGNRPDIITARVPVPLHLPGRQHGSSGGGLWNEPGRDGTGRWP
jgi:hypothetical protein